ncbi:PAS domain-containing sensor histidine kinase [Thauera butanivorans]|uniref:PAS domain-containing sensor histidine kinase n=1 Tax=Thauera butanivorans TaxID=86174 RepID=UPI003AB392C4
MTHPPPSPPPPEREHERPRSNIEADIPFRGIVEQSLAGMYVIQDELFQYVNATFASMLGYTPEEMKGMHLRQAVYPEMQEATIVNFHKRISDEIPSIRYTTIGWHRNREPVYLEVHGSCVMFRGRPAVVGVGINITEQRQQQEALRLSRERLRELAAYINTVREEQRARIARELHDVVGGMLTSMKLDIQRIQRRASDPEMQRIVGDLLVLAQESIDTVRTISEDLRPSALDHLGLRAALDAMLRRFSERTELRYVLAAGDADIDLPQARATAVYRICQEALTNIARHAQARQVHVRLSSTAGWLQVEIEDDGRGLHSQTPTGKSLGLLSMAERAQEFGGELSFRCGQAGGTCLILRLPKEDTA